MTKVQRVYHTWDKWECYRAGFYEDRLKDLSKTDCENVYKAFLSQKDSFSDGLEKVIKEWPNSCEHYLTNESMNRIAWLRQAACCIETGVPAAFRSGYFLLSKEEQKEADNVALKYLNLWLAAKGYESVDLEGAGTKSIANLY